MKNEILKKLTSRKFIVSAIAALAGIVTIIMGENEVVGILAGALMTAVPAIVYCIVEGRLDAASIKAVIGATADAAEQLGAPQNTVDAIEQVGGIVEILADETPEQRTVELTAP